MLKNKKVFFQEINDNHPELIKIKVPFKFRRFLIGETSNYYFDLKTNNIVSFESMSLWTLYGLPYLIIILCMFKIFKYNITDKSIKQFIHDIYFKEYVFENEIQEHYFFQPIINKILISNHLYEYLI